MRNCFAALFAQLSRCNLVPRALVTVPLDKGNEGSGNEIGRADVRADWVVSDACEIVLQLCP